MTGFRSARGPSGAVFWGFYSLFARASAHFGPLLIWAPWPCGQIKAPHLCAQVAQTWVSAIYLDPRVSGVKKFWDCSRESGFPALTGLKARQERAAKWFPASGNQLCPPFKTPLDTLQTPRSRPPTRGTIHWVPWGARWRPSWPGPFFFGFSGGSKQGSQKGGGGPGPFLGGKTQATLVRQPATPPQSPKTLPRPPSYQPAGTSWVSGGFGGPGWFFGAKTRHLA